jgi:hypothetical protein
MKRKILSRWVSNQPLQEKIAPPVFEPTQKSKKLLRRFSNQRKKAKNCSAGFRTNPKKQKLGALGFEPTQKSKNLSRRVSNHYKLIGTPIQII